MADDDLTDLTTAEEAQDPRLWSQVIKAVSGFREDVRRERKWKRLLLVVCAVLAVVVCALGVVVIRQNHNVHSNSRTVARLDETVRQLQQVQTDILAERAARNDAVCRSEEALVNSFLELQPKPATVVQQWLEQARLNDVERTLEARLAAFGCDLHFIAIPPPPEPPPLPGR